MRLVLICVFALLQLAEIIRSGDAEKKLEFNRLEKFLIEDLMLRQQSFHFDNPGKAIDNPYLVVNFNQFMIKKGKPSLPVVHVEGQANGRNYAYFSTENPDWTFDENHLVVPLVNFEKFIITVRWRDGSMSTSFLVKMGVFSQTNIQLEPNFIMPAFINSTAPVVEFNLEQPRQAHPLKKAIVVMRACRGELKGVQVFNENGTLEIESFDRNDIRHGLHIPQVPQGATFKIRVTADAEEGEVVVFKAAVLGLADDAAFLEKVLDHRPELVSKGNVLKWNNLGFEGKNSSFALKSFFSFDSDFANSEFKAKCGFPLEVLTKPYPSAEGSFKVKFLDLPTANSTSYEFGYFTDDNSLTEQSMDLEMENIHRFKPENLSIAGENYYASLKEMYFSQFNYENGTFILYTVASKPSIPDYLMKRENVLYSVPPLAWICLGIAALIAVIWFFRRVYSNMRRKIQGEIRLPERDPQTSGNTSFEFARHRGLDEEIAHQKAFKN